jgi:hypothetical protein
MILSERRQYDRAGSLNLLDFTCQDGQNDIITQKGMGRTLNISERGVLLETYVQLNPTHTISLIIGLKEQMIDIKGKILWCKKDAESMFLSGVEFGKMEPNAFANLQQFIESFYKEPPR